MDIFDRVLIGAAGLCVVALVTIIVLAATGVIGGGSYNPCVREYRVGKVNHRELATGFMRGSDDSVLGCLNGRIVKWEGRAW